MNYKVVAPKPVSIRIGSFGLDRGLIVRLVTAIHAEVPRDYERSRRFRTPGNEETYRHRIVLLDESTRHVFRLAVDDSTTQGFLIVVGIRHDAKMRPPQG